MLNQQDHKRDVVSVLNVSVSRRSRDAFERLGLVSVLKAELNVSVSSRSREFEKIERLGLVSVVRVQRLGLGLGSRDFRSCEHPCNASGSRIYQEENNGSDPQETGCQVRDFLKFQ